jgi:TusE/DsrC/DsvC family sulfur relay protein
MSSELSDKDKREIVFGIHDSDEKAAFDAWNEDEARKVASSMGIELTDAHWDVIRFLRTHYLNVGADRYLAHEFSKTLDERFSAEGGLKYLYQLFPEGPLSQGCRIAGVPSPHDSKDNSFGSVS